MPYWAWTERHWLTCSTARTPAPAGDRPTLPARGRLPSDRLFACPRHRAQSVPRRGRSREFWVGPVRGEYGRLESALVRLGYGRTSLHNTLPMVLAALMLERRDPRLETFDPPCSNARAVFIATPSRGTSERCLAGLAALGVLATPLRMRNYVGWREKSVEGVDRDWVAWCRRWRETSTLRPRTRETNYSFMLRTGLWLAKAHPEVTSPAQWTVESLADFLAAVDRRAVGEWVLSSSGHVRRRDVGKPMDANSKRVIYHAVRRFLGDVQLWGWATLRCNPRYHLATPTSVLRLAGVSPRTTTTRYG